MCRLFVGTHTRTFSGLFRSIVIFNAEFREYLPKTIKIDAKLPRFYLTGGFLLFLLACKRLLKRLWDISALHNDATVIVCHYEVAWFHEGACAYGRRIDPAGFVFCRARTND